MWRCFSTPSILIWDKGWRYETFQAFSIFWTVAELSSTNTSFKITALTVIQEDMEEESDNDEEIGRYDHRKGRDRLWRLLILPFIPILALIIQTTLSLRASLQYRQEVVEVEEQVSRATELGKLVTRLQLERSEVAFYIFTNGSELRSNLSQRFVETDLAIDHVAVWPFNQTLFSEKHFRKELANLREKISSEESSIQEVMQWYTAVNSALLKHLTNHIKETDSSTLWRYLVGFKNLLRSIESFGAASMLGIRFFGKGHLSSESHMTFIEYYVLARDLLDNVLNYVPSLKHFTLSLHANVHNESILILANKRRTGSVNKAITYFDVSASYIDQLRTMQRELRGTIKNSVSESLAEARKSEMFSVALLVLVLAVSPIIIILVKSAVKTIQMYALNLSEKAMELKQEKELSDSLLCQMLPPSVAMRLKRDQQVPAEYFDAVTIYFSDIEGFTEMAAATTPIQVVKFLNSIYRLFDARIECYDVYKVETIGDSYMVASGLPVKNGNNHVTEIASMALELLEATKNCIAPHKPEESVRIRSGIHTGPCVAGVVGSKMPRYCLFGDTVNTASRMESTGEALRIHISENMKLALEAAGGFRMEMRGQVNVKGKGPMTTYWLVQKDGAIPRGSDAGWAADDTQPAYLRRLHSRKVHKMQTNR